MPALSAGLGVFAGLLPAFAWKLPLLFALSAVFGLNIVCLLAGTLIPIVFSGISTLAGLVNSKLFTGLQMRYLNLAFLNRALPIAPTSAASNIITDLALSAAAFGLFFLVFKLLLKPVKRAGAHVFSDRGGRRWPVMKAVLWVLAGVAVVAMAMVVVSLGVSPALPQNAYGPEGANISNLESIPGIQMNPQTAKDAYFKKHRSGKRGNAALRASASSLSPGQVYAFYVSWDSGSLQSLQQNIGSIDTVIPNWYSLDSQAHLAKANDEDVDALIHAKGKQDMPLINNYDEAGGTWDVKTLHRLVSDKPTGDALIAALLNDVQSRGYSGINLDFEGLAVKDKKNYRNFIGRLYEAFHRQSLQVTIDVPVADEAYDYAAIASVCDHLIIMAYDEHYAEGEPGSIASNKWISELFKSLNVSGDKVIIGLGSYGYDWVAGSTSGADTVSFSDIMDICAENKLQVHWDTVTGNPYILYKEDNDNHVVWFLDAATFYNQLRQSLAWGADGVALWRLGSEDFSIWDIIRNMGNPTDALPSLRSISTDLSASYKGKGELLRIVQTGSEGSRSMQTDEGNIIQESYDSIPSGYLINRFGHADEKKIALTFDDGPDPVYTPRILSILEQNGIDASFFVIGENALNYPRLVRRMYDDGDDIGNHTFTHPNIARISAEQTATELNATQRLLQGITGHSSILFRPPYNADAEPSTQDELVPVWRAQNQGYLTVGESIDPLDWERPSKEEIVSRVMSNLDNGNIVLLHDGGGNRENTVAALPELIQALKAQGYTFVTVHDLMGVPRDGVMPQSTAGDAFQPYDQTFFALAHGWYSAVQGIFYMTVVLGIAKLLFLGALSLRQKRHALRRQKLGDYTPFVSVLIPAYNEETVVCRTIESVLASDYPNFEVIFIDDGSADNSYELVRTHFQDEPRLTCVRKENGGKSSALNRGLQETKGEIFIAIDADTLFDKNAIRLMARYFQDPRVAAVSGNVKVGNRHGLLTTWQHCEYVTGFNLERRAYSELNCITVVPGAIGAWRSSAVREAGGFCSDTLAEDADLTIALLERGYKIEFEEDAKAYTEAPETLRSLLKQRFRWTYGTLQCLWKHKAALFNRRQKMLGFVAMPFMWIFQYVFQILSPIVDIYMLISLFRGTQSIKLLIWYAVFLGIDVVSSAFAFGLEKESLTPLLWMPLQRIVYRFLMVYIVLRSVITALKGEAVGWNKLKRTGTAQTAKA